MQFLDLPTEIIIQIFVEVDPIDLFVTLRINHYLRALCLGSALLQLIMEEEVAGVERNELCPLTVSERLSSLRQRERAWRSLEPRSTTTVPVFPRPSGIYDLTPDAYFVGQGSLAEPWTATCVQYARLPSESGGVEQGWFKIGVGKSIRDFGTALEEHDLIALVTTYVHHCPSIATMLN